MSEKIDIIIDSSTDVEAGNEIVSTSSDNNIDIEVVEPDYNVTINKREYVITGDNLYIPKTYDESPQWLKDIIGTITDFSLNQKLTEIGALSSSLYALIEELNVAKNTYTNSIISSSEIDERINARIETLNSSIASSDATIVDLIATKATPTEASSLAMNVLTASINDGEISSLVSNLQNAISTTNSTLSNNIDIVHSEMTGEFEANAEVIDAIETSVTNINGTLTSHAGQITNLQASASAVDGKIATANSEVTNTVNTTIANGDATVESKWAYNSSLNIGGTTYNSGFGLSNSSGTGVGSEFWIDASRFKFTNNGKTGSAAPFTIDASGPQPQITFNGKVTFGSGQVGTIDQAIAAVVETVAVGDKNINITDNLIPTTSLVADTDNSGYQFVGTPTKSMSSGLESFSEAQIVLDGSDEVYSPYVDEISIPYYYRFGIKGITSLDRFKVVTINSSNVVTYNDVTVTMESGQTLSAGNWYTIDGIINPLGGTTTADGDIRDINGVKFGSINNFVIPAGTTKVLLGWVADCTISRMKMCKITADTITSDFSSVNGQLINLQSQIDNVDVSWNSLSGKDVFAQKLGYANYNAMVAAAASGQTVINGGYINTSLISAGAINAGMINTTGLIAENISTTEINSITINGGIINGARINGAVIKASYLDLDGELEVLTNYHISVATRNSNPSLYSDAVYISSDNEYRIPSLSTIKEANKSVALHSVGASSTSLNRSYNTANVGHNNKCVSIRPTLNYNGTVLTITVNVAPFSDWDGAYNVLTSYVTSLYCFGTFIGRFKLISTTGSGSECYTQMYVNDSVVTSFSKNVNGLVFSASLAAAWVGGTSVLTVSVSCPNTQLYSDFTSGDILYAVTNSTPTRTTSGNAISTSVSSTSTFTTSSGFTVNNMI